MAGYQGPKIMAVEAGPKWTEILHAGDVPALIINRISKHLSAIDSDDLVYTNYFGSVRAGLESHDVVERLVVVGADGAGRELRRRSFTDEPDILVEDVSAIYLCRAASTDRPEIPYVFIDTSAPGSDTKAKLMCRRDDFVALHSLLRMGGKGGVLWRGAQVESEKDILGLNENDYEFQDNILSDLLDQTVYFLEGPKAQQLRAWGIPPKRGVILYGRPGNGKTVLTRLCAKRALELSINVVIIEGKRTSRFSYDRIGFGDELRQAAARGPALILFEDLDLHCPPRPTDPADAQEVDNSQLAEMLEFLDGVVPTKGYALLATTNYIERIDPALARSGRLEGRFNVQGPALQTRVKLLEQFLEIGPTPRPDVKAAARVLGGCSFADLAEISRRFKIAAVFTEEQRLDMLLDQVAREFVLERSLQEKDDTEN